MSALGVRSKVESAWRHLVFSILALLLIGCTSHTHGPRVTPETFVMNYDTPTDRQLQRRIERLDARLRQKYGMTTEQTAEAPSRGLCGLTHQPLRTSDSMSSSLRFMAFGLRHLR